MAHTDSEHRPFRARSGRRNYIKVKRGRHYYRRAIPAPFRETWGGKTEWVIPLQGQTDAERTREALAIAHRHDEQMSFLNGWDIDDIPNDAVAMSIILDPENLPPGEPPPKPKLFWRAGQWHEVYRYTITDDPVARRNAEAEGFFVMSVAESDAQDLIAEQRAAHERATTQEGRELAELKGERAAHEVDTAARDSGHTVLSVLPLSHDRRKQVPSTWKKHKHAAHAFADLFGNPVLTTITKRQVVEFVEHCQAQRLKDGSEYSPTSIASRLDSIKALLSYAASADLIPANPAVHVKPPRDTRPKTAQSWKSFEPQEVKKLLKVATALWTEKREGDRRDDLITALHCLVWTGARPEEICQLRREDVDLARRVINITNDASGDDARPRMLKNARSVREIPIHSQLLPILEAHVRQSNSPLLFPTFEPTASRAELTEAKETGRPVVIKGWYHRRLAREWTDRLRQVIVPNDPRKVLYSLRHSWAAELRRSGMPEHVRNAIMGHADDNQHAIRYGGDADWLEEKRRHLERMNCA